jgi:hypothetical protein
MCIPNSALPGIENAADNSAGNISTAQCPCFSGAEIQAAIGAGTYTYQAEQGVDCAGNICRTARVEGFGFSFLARTKSGDTTKTEDCLMSAWKEAMGPNSCWKQVGNTGPLLINGILPEESFVCVGYARKIRSIVVFWTVGMDARLSMTAGRRASPLPRQHRHSGDDCERA